MVQERIQNTKINPPPPSNDEQGNDCASKNLDDNHTKVTSFKVMFEQVKGKLNGKPTTKETTLTLPFEVENEPLHIESNYYVKGNEENTRGVVINHVNYVCIYIYIHIYKYVCIYVNNR